MRTRNHDVKIRMNDKEYDRFKKKVKKTGLSQQAFLKKLIDGAEIKERPGIRFFEILTGLQSIHRELLKVWEVVIFGPDMKLEVKVHNAVKKVEDMEAELIQACR